MQDSVVSDLLAAHRLDGEQVGAVGRGDLEGLQGLLGIVVLLVHSGPQALLRQPGVGDGMPDGQGNAIFIVVLLHQLLLAGDHWLLELLRVVDHLEDVLVLQLNRREPQGDRSVEDVLGDIVDVLAAQRLWVLFRARPRGEVDLGNDHSCTDGLTEAVGHRIFGFAEDHLIRRAVLHLGVSLDCHFFHLQ